MNANGTCQLSLVRDIIDRPCRILIVDDDPIQGAFSSIFLQSPTTEVVCALSGSEGLKSLGEHSIDFILVDYDMRDMTGLEFIKKARSKHGISRIPIIMVTGRKDASSVNAAYDAGALKVFSKPVDWPLLAQSIRNHLC